MAGHGASEGHIDMVGGSSCHSWEDISRQVAAGVRTGDLTCQTL